MGTYLKGILGSFSGKVGTVIGSSWNGIAYMRSIGRPSSAAPTAAQLLQRAKFALVMAFVSPIQGVFKTGFKSASVGQTGVNAATSYILSKAVTGLTLETVELDYPKILFSKGPLASTNGLAESSLGRVDLSWEDNSGSANASATDRLVMLVYCEEFNQYVYEVTAVARPAGDYSLIVPANFIGFPVEVWFAFQTADGKTMSTSLHAGQVVVVA